MLSIKFRNTVFILKLLKSKFYKLSIYRILTKTRLFKYVENNALIQNTI